MAQLEFNILLGKTLTSITNYQYESLLFTTIDGEQFKLYHAQDCCEICNIEDISGNLQDLIGEPILLAEEICSVGENPPGVPIPEYQDSFTWTFYKLSTIRGSVTIRWYGDSNGYYSESVDFVRITN